jgi:hypothetical protein
LTKAGSGFFVPKAEKRNQGSALKSRSHANDAALKNSSAALFKKSLSVDIGS